MRAVNHFLAIALSLFSLASQAAVTEVTATIDKNPAMIDESITLQVVANDNVGNDAFDPSPLLKDFVVGRTSVGSQTQIVNGSISKSTTWSTILIPRQPGQYTIPAFSVAGQKTQPINLMVLPASASKNSRGRDLFITTETEQQSVYLQQQLRYTVKLHLAMDLQRGSLSAPSMEGAEIRQVGKDKEYSQIVEGKRFRIIERVYAIIPQQSGKFVINGPLFEGEVIDNNRQSFGFFNRTKSVNRIGPNIEIEVKPAPANYQGHWLPSEMVQLHEEWQPANAEFKTGEPITRTLTLTAIGLVEEQLPEINSQYPDTVKTYPDQATTTTVEKDGNLIAQRVETIAIIPAKAGSLTLPAVEVPWFNVVTQETEIARLPAKTIQVTAAEPTQNALPATPALETKAQNQPQESAATPTVINNSLPLWSVSSWVLLLLWLLTLLAWYLKKPKIEKLSQQHPQPQDDEKKRWKQLTKALQQNNAQASHHQLQQWLAHYCQKPGQSLAQSQQQLNNLQLNAQITLLLESMFGKTTTSWQAKELIPLLQSLRNNPLHNNKLADTGLKPLYPATQH